MRFMRKPEKKDAASVIVIVILIGLFVWIGMEYTKTFGEVQNGDMLSAAENFKQLLLSYGSAGIPVLIFLHALHVIISFIPAALVQFAGSLVYGMNIGMLSGIAGVVIGTAVSFYLSRFFGRRVVTLLVSEKTIEKAESLLSSDTSTAVLFFLFLFPFPKDFFAYFIGLTNMKASKFFLISAIGRIPGMLITSYMGAHILDRNYAVLVGLVAFCCISFITAYVFKDRLLNFVRRLGKR